MVKPATTPMKMPAGKASDFVPPIDIEMNPVRKDEASAKRRGPSFAMAADKCDPLGGIKDSPYLSYRSLDSVRTV